MTEFADFQVYNGITHASTRFGTWTSLALKVTEFDDLKKKQLLCAFIARCTTESQIKALVSKPSWDTWTHLGQVEGHRVCHSRHVNPRSATPRQDCLDPLRHTACQSCHSACQKKDTHRKNNRDLRCGQQEIRGLRKGSF